MRSKFKPRQVIFASTGRCNLDCAHCERASFGKNLSPAKALRFLRSCRRAGIKRVGFTGGEPFLDLDFLCRLSKEAVLLGMLFDNIATNGVWFSSVGHLRRVLNRLKRSGYDGDFRVSVDAFHGGGLRKAACFIRAVADIWGRSDAVSIAYVRGSRDLATQAKLKRLRRLLRNDLIFLRTTAIDLAPVGRAGRLDARGGKIFKEDRCSGPGNVLYVMPDGKVRPCCGYADERLNGLTIGRIDRDSPARMIANAGKNRFVSRIFSKGLKSVRRRLEHMGATFPGKTLNPCVLCDYILKKGYDRW